MCVFFLIFAYFNICLFAYLAYLIFAYFAYLVQILVVAHGVFISCVGSSFAAQRCTGLVAPLAWDPRSPEQGLN